MRSHRLDAAFVASLLLTLPLAARAEEPGEVAPERLERAVREVKALQAPWLQIPWGSDLQAARQRAARTRRPVFLWAMEGHPLGAT